ncbi:rhodanese-like domain-containing protein [Streptomyces sp. enrichment culture]|uniref:rhodanese-like domain-containing protein n=1 Tax=Streptomyces sp. enrichment culture TaxID=1795815 RepID=UPI003F549DD8
MNPTATDTIRPTAPAPTTPAAPGPAPAASASAPRIPSGNAPASADPVLRVPPAAPPAAAAYFAASLAFHTDVADVAAALAADGGPAFALLDSRSTEAWDQGHIPGAVHLPTARIAAEAGLLLDKAVPVVTYCWGPGCDGATRAALALAELGYHVKEMRGGFEYWVREGFPYETSEGRRRGDADPLTAPVAADDCGC